MFVCCSFSYCVYEKSRLITSTTLFLSKWFFLEDEINRFGRKSSRVWRHRAFDKLPSQPAHSGAWQQPAARRRYRRFGSGSQENEASRKLEKGVWWSKYTRPHRHGIEGPFMIFLMKISLFSNMWTSFCDVSVRLRKHLK